MLKRLEASLEIMVHVSSTLIYLKKDCHNKSYFVVWVRFPFLPPFSGEIAKRYSNKLVICNVFPDLLVFVLYFIAIWTSRLRRDSHKVEAQVQILVSLLKHRGVQKKRKHSSNIPSNSVIVELLRGILKLYRIIILVVRVHPPRLFKKIQSHKRDTSNLPII